MEMSECLHIPCVILNDACLRLQASSYPGEMGGSRHLTCGEE